MKYLFKEHPFIATFCFCGMLFAFSVLFWILSTLMVQFYQVSTRILSSEKNYVATVTMYDHVAGRYDATLKVAFPSQVLLKALDSKNNEHSFSYPCAATVNKGTFVNVSISEKNYDNGQVELEMLPPAIIALFCS